MEGSPLSRYPHLSWLGFRVVAPDHGRSLVVPMEGVAHTISLTTNGSHAMRQITRGQERRWHESPGTVHFHAADGDEHVFITSMSPAVAVEVFVIPPDQLCAALTAEGCAAPDRVHRFVQADDHVLQACLARLATNHRAGDASTHVGDDELARRLLLRIGELSGAGLPDWWSDTSSFERPMLARLVAAIDSRLRTPPSVAEMATIAGLSPAHFARKFRQTTGLSLQRFVNRRRLGRSLELLQAGAEPLPALATGLGFASQSHFTRLFSDFTGMTPARFRRQLRRSVAMPATLPPEARPIRPPSAGHPPGAERA